MVKQPQNRLEAVRPVVEKLGGKFEHAWVAFGEYDIVGVVELPEIHSFPTRRSSDLDRKSVV